MERRSAVGDAASAAFAALAALASLVDSAASCTAPDGYSRHGATDNHYKMVGSPATVRTMMFLSEHD